MDITLDAAGQQRLIDYFDEVGKFLTQKRARASFATYAMGLLGDGERKSVEPIAARACGAPEATSACQQRLLHFLNDSPWCDRDVRLFATRYAIDALTAHEPIASWIIDDTGFLKQGKHSVGVQRQYSGTAGKVSNCQIGVSLSLASASEHLPVDFELYLPECWANDRDRRKEARIPDEVVFQTKPAIALDMISRAVAQGLPRGIVLADAAFGNNAGFRLGLYQLGMHFAVAIEASTKVYLLDERGRPKGRPVDVRSLGADLAAKPKKFRRINWREGTNGLLSARFAVCPVITAHKDGVPLAERPQLTLVVEWRDDEPHPARYHLAFVPPMSRRQLIHRIKDRWRTERVYQDLKGELGLDHFEGRRFPGWHHHVSVALSCYAFVVAERMRRFPPSAARDDSLAVAA